MVSSSSTSSSAVNNNNPIAKKITKGRQKIEIKKIESKESRQVTFSKRRAGLFKKAFELSKMTGAKVSILVKSPGGKLYVFGEDHIDWLLKNVVETAQLGFPGNECDGDVSQGLVVGNSEEASVVEMGFPRNEFDQEEDYADFAQELEDEIWKADDSGSEENPITVLDSDDMKTNMVNEANDLMIDNNQQQPTLDSDDMSWLDLDMVDMSCLTSDTFDISGINNYNDTFGLNFHHGVAV